jgi:hypothetical protein
MDAVLAIDPMLPIGALWRGFAYVQSGDTEAAERMFRRAQDGHLAHAGMGLSTIALLHGDHAAAKRHLRVGLQPFIRNAKDLDLDMLVDGILGDAAARDRARAAIEAHLSRDPQRVEGVIPYALLRMGDFERAFALFGDAPTDNDPLIMSTLWSPYGRDARRAPTFGTFAVRSGLAAYWDVYGAPDLCRKRDSADYLCE